jgi:hypothetical protein
MASLTAHPYLPTFRLPRRPPVAGPPLAKGERVVVSARDARTRRRVVATPQAVYYQDLAGGLRSWHRLGWEQVERAEWDHVRAELRLVSREPEVVPDLTLRLREPGRLPALARERVTATTLARVPVRRGGEVVGWVTARRPVAGDGEVAWVVRLAPGVDADVAGAVAQARASLGI